MGILLCMAFCAELLNLILTKEVDEVQKVRGVLQIETDIKFTCVELNSKESKNGPCDALNLE